METKMLNLTNLTLIDGESIDSTLNLNEGTDSKPTTAEEFVLLTNKRIIYRISNSSQQTSLFACLEDIHSVEISSQKPGYSGMMWGAMAIIVAAMLYLIWDEPVWSILAAIAVSLMGVYLVIDQIMTPATVLATFRIKSSDIKCKVQNQNALECLETFVNRLFELKTHKASRELET